MTSIFRTIARSMALPSLCTSRFYPSCRVYLSHMSRGLQARHCRISPLNERPTQSWRRHIPLFAPFKWNLQDHINTSTTTTLNQEPELTHFCDMSCTIRARMAVYPYPEGRGCLDGMPSLLEEMEGERECIPVGRPVGLLRVATGESIAESGSNTVGRGQREGVALDYLLGLGLLIAIGLGVAWVVGWLGGRGEGGRMGRGRSRVRMERGTVRRQDDGVEAVGVGREALGGYSDSVPLVEKPARARIALERRYQGDSVRVGV